MQSDTGVLKVDSSSEGILLTLHETATDFVRPVALGPAMVREDRTEDDKVLSYGDNLLRQSDVDLLNGPHWLNDQVLLSTSGHQE